MQTTWREPLVLKCSATGEVITIRGPREALVILACRWPTDTEHECFLAAMQACSEALGQPEAVETARRAVLDAAQEAGLSIGSDGVVELQSQFVQLASHHSYRLER